MEIADNILRYHLRNVLFVNGCAYAGKSTLCAMLAQKHGLYHYRENSRAAEHRRLADPAHQPELCYPFGDWERFFNRSPEDYERWIYQGGAEEAGMEIIDLIQLAQDRRVIVDSIIPVDMLRRIAGYHQVAILLAPPQISVSRFFDREDKQDILACIQSTRDPERTMANFRASLARINSPEHYREYADSGFFCLSRGQEDTLQENFRALERHFGLSA